MQKLLLVTLLFIGIWEVLPAQKIVYIDSLDLSKAEQDDYPLSICKNVKGNSIKINHIEYQRGIGTYTNSIFHIDLKKGSDSFSATVGFDDEVLGQGCHPIEFITPTEQYAHVSLWSLLSAPLLLGADLTRLDDFTINLLANNEVIGIDQDILGKAPTRIKVTDLTEIWVKELSDGSKAVGLCNFGILKHTVRLNFSELGLNGSHILHDVWRQKDIGTYAHFFESEVKPHGVFLLKVIN